MEQRVLELTRENSLLRAELYAIKEKFGLPPNQPLIDMDGLDFSLPETNGGRGRRNKLLSAIIPTADTTPVTPVNATITNATTGVAGSHHDNSPFHSGKVQSVSCQSVQ